MSSFGKAARTGNAEGRCDLAAFLPIAHSGGGELAEPAELAFEDVAADAAANASQSLKRRPLSSISETRKLRLPQSPIWFLHVEIQDGPDKMLEKVSVRSAPVRVVS